MSFDPRIFPCHVQNRIPVRNQFLRYIRIRNGEKRFDIHLCIPEKLSLIPFAAESFGGNIAVLIFTDRLYQLKKVISDRHIELIIAFDFNRAVLPVFCQIFFLFPVQCRNRNSHCFFHLQRGMRSAIT